MLVRKLSVSKAAAARKSRVAAERQQAVEAFVASENLAVSSSDKTVEKNLGQQLESLAAEAEPLQAVARAKSPRQHRSDDADLS